MKGHIRQRGRDTWQLFYELPAGPDGRRRQKSETVHGPKKAAQVRLREILSSIDSGRHAEPGRMTVGDYLGNWLETLLVSERTLERYSDLVRLHIKPVLGDIRLSRLTALHIESLYQEKRSSGRADGKAGGLSERTVLHIHRVLSESLKRAVRLKLLAHNPCLDVDAPKPVRKEVSALSEDQTGILLDAAKDTRLYALILAAVTTGLRLGELLGLKWDAVDLDGGVLQVRRSLMRSGSGLVIVDTLKTKTSRRTVALPTVAVEALSQHRRDQLADKMRLRPVWQEHDLVFPYEDGSPWHPQSVQWYFKRLARRIGLDITFHGLRHSHATHLLRAGIHPKIASGRLGHSTIGITMDLYSHLLADAQSEAAEKIDAAIRGVLK